MDCVLAWPTLLSVSDMWIVFWHDLLCYPSVICGLCFGMAYFVIRQWIVFWVGLLFIGIMWFGFHSSVCYSLSCVDMYDD